MPFVEITKMIGGMWRDLRDKEMQEYHEYNVAYETEKVRISLLGIKYARYMNWEHHNIFNSY